MTTFARRLFGAVVLDAHVYEEVEADRGANGQAVAVVLLASVATGIGLPGVDVLSVEGLLGGIVGAIVGWVAWAALTYTIGTRLLPAPETRADLGQLLRTLAFAAAPGLFRVIGAAPFLATPVYVITSIWMLLAMVVAVRQALDYTSTARAVAVCAAGWALSVGMVAIIGWLFAPTVS